MRVGEVEIQRAWDDVCARFPFQGYLDPLRRSNLDVARTVARFLAPGSCILDFGAGPADKTALLARLGYRCTAMDDLADEWHKRGLARDMILQFAAAMDVEFIQLDGQGLPP